MILTYKNQIENYTLTADSESDTYPADNVKDIRLAKYWLGDSDTTQDFVIDCGAAVEPGIIAILGHNFSEFTPTVKILANTTSDFSSPAYSYEFTSIADIMFHVYTGVAYQYFCIRIEGCTQAPKIGLLWMDDNTFLSTGYKISRLSPLDYSDRGVRTFSDTQALFGYKNGNVYRSYKIGFDFLKSSLFVALRDAYKYCEKTIPFVLIWDELEEHEGLENIFCAFDSKLSVPNIYGFGSGYETTFDIVEVLN